MLRRTRRRRRVAVSPPASEGVTELGFDAEADELDEVAAAVHVSDGLQLGDAGAWIQLRDRLTSRSESKSTLRRTTRSSAQARAWSRAPTRNTLSQYATAYTPQSGQGCRSELGGARERRWSWTAGHPVGHPLCRSIEASVRVQGSVPEVG
eukprot:1035627-Rhodomonas_salina.1